MEIIDYNNGGNNLIKINWNKNFYNLYNEEKYCLSFNMLRAYKIETLANLNNFINNNKIIKYIDYEDGIRWRKYLWW